jgi:hypothetical protein
MHKRLKTGLSRRLAYSQSRFSYAQKVKVLFTKTDSLCTILTLAFLPINLFRIFYYPDRSPMHQGGTFEQYKT